MSNFSELSKTQLERIVKSQDIAATKNLRLSAEIITLELRKWCVDQASKDSRSVDLVATANAILQFLTEGEQK